MTTTQAIVEQSLQIALRAWSGQTDPAAGISAPTRPGHRHGRDKGTRSRQRRSPAERKRPREMAAASAPATRHPRKHLPLTH